MNDYLTGSNANLSTVLDTTLDRLKGGTIEGNDLRLTLNPQRPAGRARGARHPLRRRRRARAAHRQGARAWRPPRPTTRISSRATSTGDQHARRLQASGRAPQPRHRRPLCARLDLQGRDRLGRDRLGPLHARPRASSTPATARSTASGSTTTTPTSPFGRLDLAHGAQVLGQLGLLQHRQGARREEARRATRSASASTRPRRSRRRRTSARRAASTRGRKLFDPQEDTDVDPGRFAFGQERLLVTPLQMAMVAATIANNGVVMQPYVVDRIVAPDGSIVVRDEAAGSRPGRQAGDGAGGRRDDAGSASRAAPAPRRRSRASRSAARPDRRDRDRRPEHDVVHLLRRAGNGRRSQSRSSSRSRTRPAAQRPPRSPATSCRRFCGQSANS